MVNILGYIVFIESIKAKKINHNVNSQTSRINHPRNSKTPR